MFNRNFHQSLVVAIATLFASTIAIAAAIAPAAINANPIEVVSYA